MSRNNPWRKLRRSLFTKLFLVLFATGFVVLLIPPLYFRLSSDLNGSKGGPRHEDEIRSARLVADAIGVPPDSTVATRLEGAYGLKIGAVGPGGPLPGFSTMLGDQVPDASERPPLLDSDAWVSFSGDRPLYVVERAPYRFTVIFPMTRFPSRLNLLPLLLLTALVLSIGSGSIYLLLRPLKALSEGVETVGSGDLEHQVPSGGEDELGELARSFNRMTERIREMISAKEQLLLDVSHELRTPLTRIKVALEIPGEEARERIGESVRELEHMVSELLESSRLVSGKAVWFWRRAWSRSWSNRLPMLFSSHRPASRSRPRPPVSRSGPIVRACRRCCETSSRTR